MVPRMNFDPTAVRLRLARFWGLKARFGMERSAYYTYLNEIVSDRYTLVNGLQLLRDELQFADEDVTSDIVACGADFSVPSVCTTQAHTNCGDRIHQGEATIAYHQVVGTRFATLSEIGELKLESFSPAGGGTDDGTTLAHVTVAHQLDPLLRRRIYDGNPLSYVLACVDLQTHVGRLDDPREGTRYGRATESPWREPRAACGAIVGTLGHFNIENGVHRRIRADLGEENYALLSGRPMLANDGSDITAAVAASVVAVQGMINTAFAFTRELDERGVAHLSASVTVNRVSMADPVIYLARATVFQGEVRFQGLGTDARHYAGRMVPHEKDQRLVLTYDGREMGGFDIVTLDPSAATNTSHHDDL